MVSANTTSHSREDTFEDDRIVNEVIESGVGVLREVFDGATVADARETVLDHRDLMKNTRPSPSSRHLAGFHRFPELEPLHHLITGNRRIRDFMVMLLGSEIRTIGLTDITINRSQQWHKDLLRGAFSHHMKTEKPCELHHSKLFKVILYLQDSSSLHVVPGSHLRDIDLHSDACAIPGDDAPVVRVDAQVGDAVVIDICTTHRGSPEAAFASLSSSDPARILVSTVFGRVGCAFTDDMELGNAHRLASWQDSHT